MSYKVSEKVTQGYDLAKNLPQVQKGLAFIKDDQDNTIKEQLELVVIEAPTFHEENRSKAFAQKLTELGLTDVTVDQYKNAYGTRKGVGNTGKAIVIEGHLDTVFPFGTVKSPEIKDGVIHCPGICDDTRGLVAVLGAARAFINADIATHYDIIFMGTAREEGMGGMGGMKDFLKGRTDIIGCINIDGASPEGITYESTGMKTYAVTVRGVGGHAYGHFGRSTNPIHALSNAIATISNIKVPQSPRTTYAISNFHAGNDAGVHAIVQEATIKFNLRSNSQEELEKVDKQIFEAITKSCKEEQAKFNTDELSIEITNYVDIKAGTQCINSPIVEATYAVISGSGLTPEFGEGGNTNANPPIALGIPAVCVGAGGKAELYHTTNEWYDPTNGFIGVQNIFLLGNMLAGIEGSLDSILK